MDTRESRLRARWAQGPGTDFAEDKDDPFADLRADPSLRFGSYGLHINSQREALEKVVQAKAFAKAVKANDADVPIYLWNNRVRASGVSKDWRDAALKVVLWKFCLRCWLRSLMEDCLAYVRRTYGSTWGGTCHTKEGHLTWLGRDLQALSGVLWHAAHTSWFEYTAGSRLVHICFPAHYQGMARDRVRVFFECPGPLVRDP